MYLCRGFRQNVLSVNKWIHKWIEVVRARTHQNVRALTKKLSLKLACTMVFFYAAT